MKDALTDAAAYLAQVPGGKAVVLASDAKKSFRKVGRTGPAYINAKIWAEGNGFTVTGDRPDLAVSNIFYFRVKS